MSQNVNKDGVFCNLSSLVSRYVTFFMCFPSISANVDFLSRACLKKRLTRMLYMLVKNRKTHELNQFNQIPHLKKYRQKG